MHKRHEPLWFTFNAHSSLKDIWEFSVLFGYLKFSVSSVISFLVRWWVECYLISEGF